MNGDLNAALRLAAGRPASPMGEIDREEQFGSIGIGRGAACAPPPPPSPTKQINERIRLAARKATNRVDLGVDLDEVF